MRTRTLPAVFVLLLAVFVGLLFNLQIVQGEALNLRARRTAAMTESIPAARGSVFDRKGELLLSDKVYWTAEISETLSPADRQRFTVLCRSYGVSWKGEQSLSHIPQVLAVKLQEEALSGITVSHFAQRSGCAEIAPHVLGRVGVMDPEEWEVFQKKGYAMDAFVGKDGAELAFEPLLHGTDGEKYTELGQEGEILSQTFLTEAVAGEDVTLTLDKKIQLAARTALLSFLSTHPLATGGAAVVLDVKNGGVLAMVSLPDYDPADFSKTYAALSRDPHHPLINRAIQGLYAPGSAFKLVTAAAALEEGILTPETQILDTGRYTYYRSPQPQCWLFRQEGRTHGLETVREAIADSCNIFFYDAGRRVGIETLTRYAHALGLGKKTGIELAGEAEGVTAGPAYTASVGGTWYEGSVLSAAIGQENNRFTPLQLAHMTATLVSGTRWQVHLQKGNEKRLGTVSLSPENLAAIKEGMLDVTKSGSLASAFRSVPVEAGAKTGSAQVAGEAQSNAVLVCFAPWEEPEVAVAIVAEQGGSGSALGTVAADILKACFPS